MNLNVAVPSRRPDARTIALGVAGVLAVGTGLLTYNYLTAVGASAPVAVAQRTVVVAAKDLPPHTTLAPDMLRVVTRPVTAVDTDALDRVPEAAGTTIAVGVPAGSAITRSKLLRPVSGLETRMRPGMRAVAIALDRVRGVSGLMQPGDIVDVIAVTSQHGNGAPRAATIVRNVRVLSIGTALDPSTATPAPDGSNYATATLELTPEQTSVIALADLNATLRLALHGGANERSRPQLGDRLDLSAPEPARPIVAPPLAPPAAPAAPVQRAPLPKPTAAVAIIDGDTRLQ